MEEHADNLAQCETSSIYPALDKGLAYLTLALPLANHITKRRTLRSCPRKNAVKFWFLFLLVAGSRYYNRDKWEVLAPLYLFVIVVDLRVVSVVYLGPQSQMWDVPCSLADRMVASPGV